MSNRKKEILALIQKENRNFTAGEIAIQLNIDRSNASRYLNELFKSGKISKIEGRPVLYATNLKEASNEVKQQTFQRAFPYFPDTSSKISFDQLIGAEDSLKISIQQGKAAIMYPPKGLHTVIFGETGTGKSLFAECMYQFALETEILPKEAPFIAFNCADYAQNPQLLFGHIFGVKKGAYTGADEDRVGLVKAADGGILFLDEIHRLPPEGQEMLFHFIDKGSYHALGETGENHHAMVQIIGATTESSDTLLATFTRRIPMTITLPNLQERSLDERFEIVTRFIKQEAFRLKQQINVEKDVIFAFMLYNAEGNIGQVKRDLKLVCARAFLHYRSFQEQDITITQKDLPLQVQKGLLKIKEVADRLLQFVDTTSKYLQFDAKSSDIVWSKDPTSNMDVYDTIEAQVETLSQTNLATLDLEARIALDVDNYFQDYVHELAQRDIQKDIINSQIRAVIDDICKIAEARLQRSYNETARFTFALHLQSTVERIRENKRIVHPQLNDVRKKYSKEFQVAIEISSLIEDAFNLDLPFDEIGFITMFLAVDMAVSPAVPERRVQVILLMHGKSTASSMLEAVQELLQTATGIALNMPLTMDVKQMYEQLKNYIVANRKEMTNGIILLTDMGSLNTFGDMLYEETGIRTKAVSMVSTMIALEAVRMADAGKSLEDIYQNIYLSFDSILREKVKEPHKRKQAIIVTCFTGEGVAGKLHQRIAPVIDTSQVEIIQMQFLERDTFKKHIDELLNEYEIKAIAGTVNVEYQNIPFFSAIDLFDDSKLNTFKRIVGEAIPIQQMTVSLEGTLKNISSVEVLLLTLQKIIHQIQSDVHLTVEAGVDVGLIIHSAFLIDSLKSGRENTRDFPNLTHFSQEYRYEMDIIRMNFLPLEKRYRIQIPDADVAYLTQMFLENSVNTDYFHN